MKKLILAISGIAIVASCGTTKTYEILAKSGTETNGTATFTQVDGKVTLQLKVNKLTPGAHAVHLHDKADCSSADGSSAGGHWNPTSHQHGKWGHHEHHMGDIGNIIANNNGEVNFSFTTDKWCIGCEDTSKNIIGKGLIIHAGVDDFTTQPTGNAGGRVGCVEIK